MIEFFQREDGMTGTRFQSWAAGLLVVLGVVGLVVGTGVAGVNIGVGVLMFFVVQWARKNPLIQLHDDHMNMKAAPAAGRHLVLYRDMTALVEESPSKVFVTTKRGERLRLPTPRLNDADRTSLLTALRERIRSAAR